MEIMVHSENWCFTGDSCPKCGSKMIRNKKEECGDLHCDYEYQVRIEGGIYNPRLGAFDMKVIYDSKEHGNK